MFDVNFNFDDIYITSVEAEDIRPISDFINSQKDTINQVDEMFVKYDELYQRFLEYYVSECEFFIRINKDNKMLGIMKGRIEFKNPNEVWIMSFIIDDEMRNRGYGSNILHNVVQHFNKIYGIRDFFFGVNEKDKISLSFLKNNGCNMIRIAQDFYDLNDGQNSMIILKKNL